MRNVWKSGDWLAICDSCGLEFFGSQLTKRWDGMMVCEKDWEPRHPQDFVRGVPDKPNPPWVRPDRAEETITLVTGTDTLASGVFSVYITGSGYTVTLPLASSVNCAGEGFTLETGDTSTNITLARQGADLVNYATSIILRPNTKYQVISDNSTNWQVQ